MLKKHIKHTSMTGETPSFWMNHLNKTLLTLFFLVLSGCTSAKPDSFEELAAEVNSSVKDNMLFTSVTMELSKLDFSCQEGTSINPDLRGIHECSRSRSGFLYTCIHKVFFQAKNIESTISNLKIDEPICAGL